jgi:hypothetical protein
LVGEQIQAGTYSAQTRSGCYWERRRNFQGTLSAIIANDFVDAGGRRRVTIRSSDEGFLTDDECGTWTRDPGLAPFSEEFDDGVPQSPASIEEALERHRATSGHR